MPSHGDTDLLSTLQENSCGQPCTDEYERINDGPRNKKHNGPHGRKSGRPKRWHEPARKRQKAPSLAYLDLHKLSKAAKAEFEYGTFTVGKAKRTVNALVKKGMVIGLEIADCDDCRNDASSAAGAAH
jgi:hypothetical protein